VLLLAPIAGNLQAAEQPLPHAIAAEQQHKRFTGVWALTDNANNLFNVRLSADGRAVSTSGVDGVPLGSSSQLRDNQLYEQGRWYPWGNGGRIDYSDGRCGGCLSHPSSSGGSVRDHRELDVKRPRLHSYQCSDWRHLAAG
jgi:hypothetical protein